MTKDLINSSREQFEQNPLVKEIIETTGHGRIEIIIADNKINAIIPSPRYKMDKQVVYPENTSIARA